MEAWIMKRILIAHLAIVVGLLAMPAAQAQDKDMRGACRADVQKLCKDIQPGGGRVATCLKQHESELSPGCQQRMAEAREKGKEFAEACKADAGTVCKGVQPGQGRILRCLAENKDKLSSACRAEIDKGESNHPCMADAERLCKGVQPGGGRMMECMKQHEAELSPECKAHQGERMGGDKK
jgi:hypothetical protein